MKKYIRMSSAAFVIGALRVNNKQPGGEFINPMNTVFNLAQPLPIRPQQGLLVGLQDLSVI